MNATAILIIIAAVFVTAVFMGCIIPYLLSKGVNVGGILGNTKTTIDVLQTVIEGIKPMFPDTSKLDLVTSILYWADAGVHQAEQLYLAGQLDKDMRKDAARKYVWYALDAAGIEVTDSIETVIDGAIEAAVNLLPPTHYALESKK